MLANGAADSAFVGTENVHHFVKEHIGAVLISAGAWVLQAESGQRDDFFVSESSCRQACNIYPDEMDPLVWKLVHLWCPSGEQLASNLGNLCKVGI